MSFINGNTVSPVDQTYIGFFKQTNPFQFNQYASGSQQYLYDTTYVIPKGVWLVSATVLIEPTDLGAGNITNTNVAIALPSNITGKNTVVLRIDSGYVAYTASVCEPYYSDGTKRCGIYFYAETLNSSNYYFQGGVNTTMTYVKIA
jgi:hypothetical protein